MGKLANINGANYLVNDLNALTSHEDNIYLNSLVNHSKHRSNIAPNLSYELAKTGVDAYKFSFQEFLNIFPSDAGKPLSL